MSKSIYDEVSDILLDSLQDPQDEDDDCSMLSLNQMNKISKAIRMAQKQEKLLEHYKEALETNFEGITLIKLVNKTLRTQIKELEK